MIRVNDKWDISWQDKMTVDDVLKACQFTHHQVVVSINGKLVPAGEYHTQPVSDGDQLKVVHIIGGG
jgi:sulfur carrier protein